MSSIEVGIWTWISFDPVVEDDSRVSIAHDLLSQYVCTMVCIGISEGLFKATIGLGTTNMFSHNARDVIGRSCIMFWIIPIVFLMRLLPKEVLDTIVSERREKEKKKRRREEDVVRTTQCN